ncbi:MAG: TetR/AcrR family transcriptional regulator [Terracidiphilus sp.]|jgi:AcrR family transcriptional regulator
MPETKGLVGPGASERILATATSLFARHGYNGVSTRDIASAAQVNEVTIFRHYPRKHDLYLAVMKSGLRQLHLRGDLLTSIAEARDGQTALARTFDLISKTLMEKPDVLRLLQYSALELSADFEPLVRLHLSEFVEVTARYLEPWIQKGELRCASGKTLIFTLVAIVASYSAIQRVFASEGVNPDGMFEVCAGFYAN